MRDDEHELKGDPHALSDGQHSQALTLLENRRLAIDNSIWQAPTLTLIAQAFLLSVLTDESVGWAVAAVVAVAGVVAVLAALLALWLLQDRELDFGRRVDMHARALGLGTPNRQRRRHGRHVLEWKGRWVWGVVLVLFAVADVVALIVTRT
jgi:hypothetical protein